MGGRDDVEGHISENGEGAGGSKSVDRGDEVRLYCALDHGVDEGQKEA